MASFSSPLFSLSLFSLSLSSSLEAGSSLRRSLSLTLSLSRRGVEEAGDTKERNDGKRERETALSFSEKMKLLWCFFKFLHTMSRAYSTSTLKKTFQKQRPPHPPLYPPTMQPAPRRRAGFAPLLVLLLAAANSRLLLSTVAPALAATPANKPVAVSVAPLPSLANVTATVKASESRAYAAALSTLNGVVDVYSTEVATDKAALETAKINHDAKAGLRVLATSKAADAAVAKARAQAVIGAALSNALGQKCPVCLGGSTCQAGTCRDVTVTSPPSAPTSVAATSPSSGTVVVSFNAPSDPGNPPGTQYAVKCVATTVSSPSCASNGTGVVTTTVPASASPLQGTLSSLVGGTVYRCYAIANNGAVGDVCSAASNDVTVTSPYAYLTNGGVAANQSTNDVFACAVSGSPPKIPSTVPPCKLADRNFSAGGYPGAAFGIAVADGYAYLTNGGRSAGQSPSKVYACAVSGSPPTLSSCQFAGAFFGNTPDAFGIAVA